MDAAEKQEILDAISRVESKLDQKSKDDDARFKRLEEELEDTSAQVEFYAKKQADFADALGKCASAAAHATDVALQAQRRSSEATDEATKIVQAAMTIHNASIGATVDAALKPVHDKLGKLEENDTAQSLTLQKQDDVLLTVAAFIASTVKWKNHWAFKLGLFVAGVILALLGKAHLLPHLLP